MSHAASAAPSIEVAAPTACLNCGESFGARGERRRRFCPECGQETTVRAPTLGEFAQQFGGAYFAAEGALWRSLKLLLLKPGALTVQYLAGRRKHYVLPLRLYLTISLLVLLAVRVAGSGPVEIKGDDPATIARRTATSRSTWERAGPAFGTACSFAKTCPAGCARASSVALTSIPTECSSRSSP
jgi:predicted RNA-binding Zn-ribbon protein involved in translation (DUF1610 family)